MDNDDRLVGRILSRREALALFGAAGAMLIVGCSGDDDDATVAPMTSTTGGDAATSTSVASTGTATSGASSTPTSGATSTEVATTAPTVTSTAATGDAATTTALICVVSPELTEGPYFVDEQLNRSDIRSDPSTGAVSEGTPLELTLRVYSVGDGGCTPLEGAVVDIWHCDAFGVYSDASDPGFSTIGQKFLRGYQVSDATGGVTFVTIYPGWYRGRAVHIHFKVRSSAGSSTSYEFTSQFFFDEDLTDVVQAAEPYAVKGVRTIRNEDDNIYQESEGATLLYCTPSGDGYASTFDVGMQIG